MTYQSIHMNTPYNSVSPVAGGRGQPTCRCRPAGGAPHPAAGPGARFPGGRPFRCDGRGHRDRTVAAAAGRGSGGAQGRRGVFRNLMSSTMFLYAARSSSCTTLLTFSLVAAPGWKAYVQLDCSVAVPFAKLRVLADEPKNKHVHVFARTPVAL